MPVIVDGVLGERPVLVEQLHDLGVERLPSALPPARRAREAPETGSPAVISPAASLNAVVVPLVEGVAEVRLDPDRGRRGHLCEGRHARWGRCRLIEEGVEAEAPRHQPQRRLLAALPVHAGVGRVGVAEALDEPPERLRALGVARTRVPPHQRVDEAEAPSLPHPLDVAALEVADPGPVHVLRVARTGHRVAVPVGRKPDLGLGAAEQTQPARPERLDLSTRVVAGPLRSALPYRGQLTWGPQERHLAGAARFEQRLAADRVGLGGDLASAKASQPATGVRRSSRPSRTRAAYPTRRAVHPNPRWRTASRASARLAMGADLHLNRKGR